MNRRHRLHTDADMVTSAANQRGCSEFDIFKAAHAAWFDQCVSDREIERFFVPYLFYQRTPHWVRHYVRDLQTRSAQDTPRRDGMWRDSPVCLWMVWLGFVRVLLRKPRSEALLIA